MPYVKSTNIKVYPSGYRGVTNTNDKFSYNPESKLNVESNAIRAMKDLIRYNNSNIYKGQGDFVLTENYNWNEVPKTGDPRNFESFEFFIKGYYFKILDSYEAFNAIINPPVAEGQTQTHPAEIYAKITFATGNAIEPSSETSSESTALIDNNNNFITGRHLGNLEQGTNAGKLTPSNINDDAIGTIIDFTNLDNQAYYDPLDDNPDEDYYFTGLQLYTGDISAADTKKYYFFKILQKIVITPATETEPEVYNYIVPSQSKFILNLQNIFGGTDENVDKPLNEYLKTGKIKTDNLYVLNEKSSVGYQSLIIDSDGKVNGHSMLEPQVEGPQDDRIRFVSKVLQDAKGQVNYLEADIHKAGNVADSSGYQGLGVVKGSYQSTDIYGKHYLKVDSQGTGYVDGVIDGLPVKENQTVNKMYILGYSSCDSSPLDYGYSNTNFYISGNCLNVSNLYSSNEITANGRITANNFYANSDKRLKENLKTFNYGPSILDLPIYRYDYIDGDKNQIGCLAQDLHELYPELVREDKDCYLSIQENKLVYLLIEEIKRLTKRVEKLEKKSK